jgi:hypothetical protein
MTHTKDEVLKLALGFVNDIRRGKYKGDAEEVSTTIKQALSDATHLDETASLAAPYVASQLVQQSRSDVEPVARVHTFIGPEWAVVQVLGEFNLEDELYTTQPNVATPLAAQPAPVQDLPFGVGGGLVAIKTLLSRDPCVHANTAIEMLDAILKEHPAAQRQWVHATPWRGLTDEEIIKATENIAGRKNIAQAIEAKLKEKNSD